jgi:hypothetical protein
MGKKKDKAFKPFSKKKQEQYERVARLQYGAEPVNQSIKLWNSYGKAKQEAIMEEGGKNYRAIVKAMEAGANPQDAEVQKHLKHWHEHMHYFYEPTLEILRGLGEAYFADPEFNAFFTKIHSDLPEFLSQGIAYYVDDLESAEIALLLAEDESSRLTG